MSERHRLVRMILVGLAVLAAQGGLAARLVYLHLGPNDALRGQIQDRRRLELEIVVNRGRVLDRNGDILAMDLILKDVCADPKLINEQQCARFIGYQLARVLQLDPAVVLVRLGAADRRFQYIKRFVSMDIAARIAGMRLPGVFFEETSKRNYPKGNLACHVVGFSNMEGVGSAGVEQHLDRYLKGAPGLRLTEKDGQRHEIYTKRGVEIPPQEGATVFLTLDATVQYYAEEAVRRAVEENSAKGAWAIVERVRTGEILAMASWPDYDLNDYAHSTAEQRRNRAISYNYEPGSTFKVAVIAAALNEHVVHPNQVFDCENGCWIYRGRPLRDYHPYGRLTVADIIKKSSNIGAAKIAMQLGDQRMRNYLAAFGIGHASGIELPGEEGGILNPLRRWTTLSSSRIAMGHEVAVTALQMLNVLCAIANDGFLMKPQVVRRIEDASGKTIYEMKEEVVSRPITSQTAELMRQLLTRVTEEGGTGHKAAIPGLSVAGKTGTAQKPVPGGYSDSANMASFVGFLPAEAPEFAAIVVVDEPQPLHTGGAVAGPVFREIAEPVYRYLAAQPDGLSNAGALAANP